MKHLLALVVAFVLAMAPAARAAARAPSPHDRAAVAHDLAVRIDPGAKLLRAVDTLTLPPGYAGALRLELSPRARDVAATRAGKNIPVRREGGVLVLNPGRVGPDEADGAQPLTLIYALTLSPPPTRPPAGNDNPGALAGDAVAGDDWAMLMPGGGWHPLARDAANAFRLAVTAPKGLKAATQGEPLGFAESDDATVSRWSVPRPEGRLGLCLAPYQVERADDGPVPVYTFLLPGSARLAPVYLAASVRHLRFYQDLHGPYPFEKFAVVENPLPTGYGFASYTLLGSQVIALPFIPETSLRHEIAHSWWGCGVLVDYAAGNWCEGLATYVADYLARENASPEAARAYRVQALRGFTELTAGGGDFPLRRFGSRSSPASQAVGYSKALFVFHMLRRQVGDEAFFAGLRRLYAERLFTVTTWEDILGVFAGSPGFSPARSRVFARQWLTRAGGPSLALGPVDVTKTAAGYRVRGVIVQHGAPYALRLTLRADTARGAVTAVVNADGSRTPFVVDCPDKPGRLTLDPDADVFRLLRPEEIPPSVNSVKGSRALAVVLAEGAPAALAEALPGLLAGLNHPGAAVLREADLTPKTLAALRNADLLVVGAPAGSGLAALVPPPHREAPAANAPGGEQANAGAGFASADTVFTVLDRSAPGQPRRFTALLTAAAGAGPGDVAAAVGKLTHYGTFARVAFTRGQNVGKDAADPVASPLARDL